MGAVLPAGSSSGTEQSQTGTEQSWPEPLGDVEAVPLAGQMPAPPSQEDCRASPANTSNYFNSERY